MSDLIEHPGPPRNYTIPGRTIADELERLRAALIAAMEIVQQERLARSLADSRAFRIVLKRIAALDAIIAQADAALGEQK